MKILQNIKYNVLRPVLKDTIFLELIWGVRKWYHVLKMDKLGKGIIYDKQTIEILKSLPLQSNCVDIGANKGLILKEIVKYHPSGKHFAFEPIKSLYEKLVIKFTSVNVINCALSCEKGEVEFYFLESAPALSGLKLRSSLDGFDHKPSKIIVEKNLLDNIIPIDEPIAFIKIDVEGGEFDVIKGAERLINRYKPIVIFEFEQSAGKEYDIDPGVVYDYICNVLGMKLTLMNEWVKKSGFVYSRETFSEAYFTEKEFYFLAFASN